MAPVYIHEESIKVNLTFNVKISIKKKSSTMKPIVINGLYQQMEHGNTRPCHLLMQRHSSWDWQISAHMLVPGNSGHAAKVKYFILGADKVENVSVMLHCPFIYSLASTDNQIMRRPVYLTPSEPHIFIF